MTARTLRHGDGPEIGLTVLGDPLARHAILLCHPTPGASGFDPDPLVTAARSVKIISVDRPGYGASMLTELEPVPEPLVAELAVLDELESGGQHLDGVVGWGFGGLVALRLAAARPEQVPRVAVIQTPRPHGRPHAVAERRARAWMLQHHDPFLAADALEAGTRIWPLSVLGASADDEALALPGLPERLERMLDVAVRQGEAGIRHDRSIRSRRDWAGLCRDVRADVLLLYGERDERMSDRDLAWFVRRLRAPQAEAVREAGPLAIASEWDRIVSFLIGHDRG